MLLWVSTLGTYPERQAVLDAAAALQIGRRTFAELLDSGEGDPRVRIVAKHPGLNDQMFRVSKEWKHVLSIRQVSTGPDLRFSLPNNRWLLANGLRMTSLLDWNGTTSAARALLNREAAGVYYYVWAPTQVKIIDRSEVLLHGPDRDGFHTVMGVRAPAVLEAAMAYWKAVLATATPAWSSQDGAINQFTSRQCRIIQLLSQDLADQSVADLLGISLRTVRYDVAAVLDGLGVRSRFAAGLRLGEVVGVEDG